MTGIKDWFVVCGGKIVTGINSLGSALVGFTKEEIEGIVYVGLSDCIVYVELSTGSTGWKVLGT